MVSRGAGANVTTRFPVPRNIFQGFADIESAEPTKFIERTTAKTEQHHENMTGSNSICLALDLYVH